MLGPTLETERLILRPPIQADFDGFVEMCAEEDTMRFLGGAQPPAGAWRQMATIAGSWAMLGYGFFSVIEKASGKWIGRLGPWRPGGLQGDWPGNEVGYGVNRYARGKGFAGEGATAAMNWAFEHLGWDEVIHCIAAENADSIKLATRLGSRWLRHDRLLPPIDIPIEIYGQTRAEWRARQKA